MMNAYALSEKRHGPFEKMTVISGGVQPSLAEEIRVTAAESSLGLVISASLIRKIVEGSTDIVWCAS